MPADTGWCYIDGMSGLFKSCASVLFLLPVLTACESQLGAIEAQRYVAPTGTVQNCDQDFINSYNSVIQALQYPGYYASLDQEQQMVSNFATRYGALICNAEETVSGNTVTTGISVPNSVTSWNTLITGVRNGAVVPATGEGLVPISIISSDS